MFDNLALHSKATDQEMTAVEKFICFSQILKGRGHATPCRAIWGSTRLFRGQEWGSRSVGKSFYCGFHRRNRKGWANRFRRASLNNFSGFWGRGAIPGCLAPPLGWLGQVASRLECDSLMRKWVVEGPGLLVVFEKHTLGWIVSSIWLTIGGSARRQMSKHQNAKTKRLG